MIHIDQDKCIGCGECVDACVFGSLSLKAKFPSISEDCRLCGACARICRYNAIVITRKKKKKIIDWKGVLIFGEQRDGVILDVVYELLSKGKKLADKLNESLLCIVLGNLVKEINDLKSYGVDEIHYFNDHYLETFNCEIYSQIISTFVKDIKPSIFLIGATSIGRELGPRIAAKLKTGLTADCTDLEINEEGLLLQTRPAFGGNIMASIICPFSRPQMATVRPKVMKIVEHKNDKGHLINHHVNSEFAKSRIETLREIKYNNHCNIENADIIVSGGLGLGKKEGFALLQELADELNGVIAASRPAVDAGWAEPTVQVGMSGKVVQPQLYIACGISGAVQHRVGMETSDVIVAINKDERAPIFDIADFGIVADLYDFLPKLIHNLKKTKNDLIVSLKKSR
ncbi:MAG: electron transfer flavoprotein subunit alpha [Candidatus Lokiarchaeia archaeon]|nr:electron transfer flavoprotein subunit alpha [Candidatus Lokiarchaeia archaeon]